LAPPIVKAGAKSLLDRCELVGQSLPALALPVFGSSHSLAQAPGRPMLLYTWSASYGASIRLAAFVAEKLGDERLLVGICLDRDVAAAKSRAAAEKLPGDQLYDSSGAQSLFARRALLSEPGLMYLVDAAGVITSVLAHNSVEALVTPPRQ
jgi:hypothetical protein